MMMVKYVRSVFQELINDVSKGVEEVEGDETTNLPKLLFVERETEALIKPLCWTGKTPDISKHLHCPNLQVKVLSNTRFSFCLQPKNKTKPLRPDAVGGWCARKMFSTLKLSIFVPSLTVNSSSVSSRSVTVMIINIGGNALVWLDNMRNKAVKFNKVCGYDQFDTIATKVNPGHHNLTVRTTRDGMFMVSGVFVGPPDFHLRFP